MGLFANFDDLRIGMSLTITIQPIIRIEISHILHFFYWTVFSLLFWTLFDIIHSMNSPLYNDILDRFFYSKTISEYSLDAITRASEYFGNPHHSFKGIHIAGTNGK